MVRRNENERSVYALGAADGATVGVLMGLCMMCMVLAVRVEWLSVVGLVLVVATPFVVWTMLRRAWVWGYTPPTFSAVWLHGICIYLFGSLIMALIFYVTLRFGVPDWIEMQTEEAVRRLSADPSTAEQGRTLQLIIEHGDLPTPIYTAVSAIWLVAFTGSLCSMCFALILTKTRLYRMQRDNYIANSTNG